jgi:D-alanyl-D-alanine endopeptidase (penicillin-binding protein 7)
MKALLPFVFACLATAVHAAPPTLDPARLQLASSNALVVDAVDGQPIYAKGADEVTPIASLTKLMTAMVVLDAGQPLDEPLDIAIQDFDFLKGSSSRLRLGTVLPRKEMLHLALMSSENRASASLARHYPGGTRAFVEAMNAKAALLGMERTRYADPTGLSPTNVSTANDLARLVRAAADYPLIREFSTTPSTYVEPDGTGRILGFNNSNRLIGNSAWDIALQKTGYIREAGKCLVMLATIASKPVVIVLLDSIGSYTRIADAERVRSWLETGEGLAIPRAFVQGAKVTKAKVREAKSKAPVRGRFVPRTAKAGRRGGN